MIFYDYLMCFVVSRRLDSLFSSMICYWSCWLEALGTEMLCSKTIFFIDLGKEIEVDKKMSQLAVETGSHM